MDESDVAEFAALGVKIKLDQIEQAQKDFEIMPVNWDSLKAFLACETQWRVVASIAGLIWTGIDYLSLEVVLRRQSAGEHVFADVQVMEKAAIGVFIEVSDG